MTSIFKTILLSMLLFLSFLPNVTFSSSWWELDAPRVNYCDDAGECGLDAGITQVKNGLTDIEKNRTLSQYIQDIVKYLLLFVSIIAVIWIIYAGFKIMIGGGEEEKVKEGKNMIRYVLIGIVVMWLAYSIVSWLIRLLNINSITP